jgi:tetratricopeptide (TPR) repeat protein
MRFKVRVRNSTRHLSWCLFIVLSIASLTRGLAFGVAQAPVTRSAAADVADLDRRAAAAMAANDYAQAASLLEQIVKIRPHSAESYASLGLAYYSMARYDKAAESFRKSVALNPQLPHAKALLGMSEAENGRFQESLPLLEKAFATESDKEIRRMAGLHLEQAFMGLEQPLRAAEVVQGLLRDYPDDPDVLYIASRLFYQLSSRSVAHLIDVAPNSVRVRQLMAELLEASKQYAVAADQYRKAISLDPTAPGLHYRLGRMLILSSNDPAVWEEARQAFEEELKIDPTYARCYVELAEMQRKQGRLDEAEKLFARGLSINADLPEAQVGLGRILVKRGRLTDALAHFQEAVRLAPTSDVAQFELSLLYARLGRPEEAATAKALYEKLHNARMEKTVNVLMRLDQAEEESPPAQ